MKRIIVLDSSPLGLISNPKPNSLASICQAWVTALEVAGHRIIVPEIVDYEIRRELIRAGKTRSLLQLDFVISRFEYLPLTTIAMKLAAELWATARHGGIQTASNISLDIDVILAAQTLSLNDPAVVIATENVNHLSRFTSAEDWRSIAP